MSVEMLKDANPVPPEQIAGSVHEERASRLLASILADESSRRTIASVRPGRILAGASAITLVAIAVSMTILLGGKGNGNAYSGVFVFERAVAALPMKGPVVHAIWRQPDFGSGSAATFTFEEWFDRAKKIDHVLLSSSGSRSSLELWKISGKVYVVSNGRLRPTSLSSMPSPIGGAPFVGLIGEYRKALSTKKIVLLGQRKAFGRPGYWVGFRCPYGHIGWKQYFYCADRIALDRGTYLPVEMKMLAYKKVYRWNRDHTSWQWEETTKLSHGVQTSASGAPMRWRILKAELIPRSQASIHAPGGVPKR